MYYVFSLQYDNGECVGVRLSEELKSLQIVEPFFFEFGRIFFKEFDQTVPFVTGGKHVIHLRLSREGDMAGFDCQFFELEQYYSPTEAGTRCVKTLVWAVSAAQEIGRSALASNPHIPQVMHSAYCSLIIERPSIEAAERCLPYRHAGESVFEMSKTQSVLLDAFDEIEKEVAFEAVLQKSLDEMAGLKLGFISVVLLNCLHFFIEKKGTEGQAEIYSRALSFLSLMFAMTSYVSEKGELILRTLTFLIGGDKARELIQFFEAAQGGSPATPGQYTEQLPSFKAASMYGHEFPLVVDGVLDEIQRRYSLGEFASRCGWEGVVHNE